MMKKKYHLEYIDCAACAAKMEVAINKLPGVSATVNFMTQSLVLEMDHDQFEQIVPQVKKIISRIEPECCLVAE